MDKQKKDFIDSIAELLMAGYDFLKVGWLKWLGRPTKTASGLPPRQPRDETPSSTWRMLAFFTVLWVFISLFNSLDGPQRNEIPFSRFLSLVSAGKIDHVLITERFISGTLKPQAEGQAGDAFITVPLWQNDLAQMLHKYEVDYLVRSGDNWLSNLLFNWVVPIVFLVVIGSWMARRMAPGTQHGFLNLGKKSRIRPDSLPKITFDDVAGADSAKQELRETIAFLNAPEKIHNLGGHMPKGVLLVGPPGTGKTLLARAVAGEAGVPFFNISGSEFIELFVGVGAARVRELFEQARSKAPCIIFIDELDAIGRSRSGPMVMSSHDEREQTLNQILTEMDGFDPSSGVAVMAATNRPEILDKALLRAGRFDRQIVVDQPDLQDRIEILKLHSKKMTLAADIDIAVIARRTPGLVGADLANIANESAIIATRLGHKTIQMSDFEAAIDRILAGPEKKNRVLNKAEKRRVAYHEAGHALVAEHTPSGQPVHKISIIPRGVSALGFTLQLPVEERFLSTEDELKDQIAILLGGRIAEQTVLGNASTGAQNDLEKASEIARNMVCVLGMSKNMGALTYGKRQSLQFLQTEVSEYRNYSDETARLLDTEIMALMTEGENRAREIITANRASLEKLAELLQEKEVVSREEMLAVLA